jgi:hypothetical protein
VLQPVTAISSNQLWGFMKSSVCAIWT